MDSMVISVKEKYKAGEGLRKCVSVTEGGQGEPH